MNDEEVLVLCSRVVGIVLRGAVLASVTACATTAPTSTPEKGAVVPVAAGSATAVSPAASSAPPAAGPARDKGLAAPSNLPELVTKVRAILACANPHDCAPLSDWHNSLLRFKPENQETLVNLIEDPNPRVRELGAKIRGEKGKPGFHVDKGLSARVIAAFERETDDEVLRELGWAVGSIDLAATGHRDKVLDLARKHPKPRARRAIVSGLVGANFDDAKVVSFVKSLVDDPDEDVRKEAVEAMGVPEIEKDACAFWARTIDHRDKWVGAQALSELTRWPRGVCVPEYEIVLKALEKTPTPYPEYVGRMCQAPGVTPAIKKRIVTLLTPWTADASMSPAQRIGALQSMVPCDPAAAKALAKKLAADPDEYVKKEAAAIATKP